jgi:putative chitinase
MSATFTQRAFQDAAGISPELAAKWHAPLVTAMPLAEINTAERIAMFIAQCGHESGGFRNVEESLNYTPEALLATWPGRFTPTLAAMIGRTAAHAADQRAIAAAAYGGRMGNRPAPSDDGWVYRGRGLIQITGADNYRAFGEWAEKKGGVENGTDHGAMSAAWFWQANGLNKWADLCDVLTCSRVINLGGATSRATPNGFNDRLERYKRAIKVMTGRA